MPCGCSDKNKGNLYVFTAPDGTQKTFTSEVQAKVAKIRANGGTIQTVPK